MHERLAGQTAVGSVAQLPVFSMGQIAGTHL